MGFPPPVVRHFVEATGCGGVLANEPASGTHVIAEFGARHVESGHPILYTSADSVFQLATHVGVVPLETLYAWCRIARDEICVGEHAVGRVIARPFEDAPAGEGRPTFQRISEARKDYALRPPTQTIQEVLQQNGITTVSVGKIADLFAGVGFDVLRKTNTNAEGIEQTLAAIREGGPRTFIWTNLVDFDQLYGHRNDVAGFARALEEFDRAVPDLLDALPAGARLAMTADHGNDPCFPGTDHTRERVPLLLVEKGGPGWRDLGERATFADHAASAAAHFDVDYAGPGRSFV
jgi:phosphopentomutase